MIDMDSLPPYYSPFQSTIFMFEELPGLRGYLRMLFDSEGYRRGGHLNYLVELQSVGGSIQFSEWAATFDLAMDIWEYYYEQERADPLGASRLHLDR